MRISGNGNVETISTNKTTIAPATRVDVQVTQGNKNSEENVKALASQPVQELDNSEETKAKVQEAVKKMNEMLEVNSNSSKFLYHEGLDRYYVSVVDRQTEEVVKEIPPKRLLDAFYEMQKMLGMVVDEKI